MFAKLSTICFITGKVQREREARTSPPAADPAGIRVIRERARTDLTRKRERANFRSKHCNSYLFLRKIIRVGLLRENV